MTTFNTVIYAYDKKNPDRPPVKGEATKQFDRAEGSRVLERIHRSNEATARSRALTNFKEKYNLK